MLLVGGRVLTSLVLDIFQHDHPIFSFFPAAVQRPLEVLRMVGKEPRMDVILGVVGSDLDLDHVLAQERSMEVVSFVH